MSAKAAASRSFVDTDVNRDSLVPEPFKVDFSKCLHKNVMKAETAASFSASRGHPVYLVNLPSLSVSYSVGVMDPHSKTSNHRHAYESLIYVIKGRGYTLLENSEKIHWQEGDAIYVPPWNWHQHFADDQRVEYITATNLPALVRMGQTLLRQEEAPSK